MSVKCNLLWFLALAQGCSNEVRVDSTGEFALAASVAEPGQVIIVADGVYSNLHLQVEAEEVTIKAKHPGKAIISGDSRVILDGDGIVFSGFYFKDGARNPDEWGSHGPGLVTVRGNHIRITECAFHQFDSVSSGWIVTMPRSMGEVPQFLRVDHCSFTNKPSFDQVVNFNNILRANWVAHRDEEGYVPPGPMYHRLDHCYFSNPKKKGNAGAGLRIGFSGDAGGRCLVDHNLFERQDSESEIITSKTPENIFFANTYRNCRGTMNFRGGARQIALRNYFLATDRLAEYGGMFIWDNDHVVTENYFHLLRTLQHRGGAVIYLNAGPDNSESVNGFPRVCNSLFANNIILVEQGAVFDLSGLLERRIEWAAQKHNLTDVEKFLPLGNVFSVMLWRCSTVRRSQLNFPGKLI